MLVDGSDCSTENKILSFQECKHAAFITGVTAGKSPRAPLEDFWDHVPTGCLIESMDDWRINYNTNPEPAYPNNQFLREG